MLMQVISLQHIGTGVHKVQLAEYVCRCGHAQQQTPADLQAAGIWAATPVSPQTFVHETLLREWHEHRHCNPSAGLKNFLKAKDHLAESKGAQQVTVQANSCQVYVCDDMLLCCLCTSCCGAGAGEQAHCCARLLPGVLPQGL